MDFYDCNWASEVQQAFLVSLYILILPILVDNILIIASVIRFASKRKKFDILIANLAVADLIVGLSLTLSPWNIAVQSYVCLLKFALYTLSLSSSVSSLCIITVERFLSVCFPLEHLVYMTKFKLNLLIGFAWLGSGILASLPLVGWNTVSEINGDLPTCSSDFVWTDTYDMIIASFIGFGVILTTVLYFILILILNRRRKRRTNQVTGVQPRLLKGKTRMLLWAIAAFNVCWLPYVAVTVAIHANDDITITARCVRRLVVFLGFLNSALNWFIYGISNEKYKNAFRDIFQIMKRKVCFCFHNEHQVPEADTRL